MKLQDRDNLRPGDEEGRDPNDIRQGFRSHNYDFTEDEVDEL